MSTRTSRRNAKLDDDHKTDTKVPLPEPETKTKTRGRKADSSANKDSEPTKKVKLDDQNTETLNKSKS